MSSMIKVNLAQKLKRFGGQHDLPLSGLNDPPGALTCRFSA